MFPYIDLKFVQIPTYGIMIALAVIAFYYVTVFTLEKKEKIKAKTVDVILIISLIGFVILGVFAFLLNSLFHSIEVRKIEFGGFTWLGGLLFALPISLLLFNKFVKSDLNGLTILEYVMPGLILAHGIGRIGCFLAGCCYGGPTDSFLGAVYPASSTAAYYYPNSDGSGSLPLWPTQLFEAGFEIILFVILFVFRNKVKNYNIEIYCFAYSVFRFLLEFMRADDRGDTLISLSPSQVMSIILLIYGVILILMKKKIIFKNIFNKNN